MSELHVVDTVTMLATLGGFEKEQARHSYGKGQTFTAADLALIREQYERFTTPSGRLQFGKAKELALRLGRDKDGIHAALNKLRARGVLPPVGKPAPSKRPPQQRKKLTEDDRRSIGHHGILRQSAAAKHAARAQHAADATHCEEIYLREWLTWRAEQRKDEAPPQPRLARPDWFDPERDGMSKARLMAGR